MNLQRLLILVFAAALTAGTSSAISTVSLSLSGSTSGTNQSGSLTIDGVLLGSGSGNGATPFYNGSASESDGWHTISIDYKDISGMNGLTLLVNGGWATSVDLGSQDGSQTMVNGLRGDFLTLAGAPVMTVYGSGQGQYIHDSGGTTPWSGSFNGGTFGPSTTFEEQLTGWIYFGAGTPMLSDIPGQQGPPPDGGGAAPEPAGWWLVAAALPLMLSSKIRPNRARTCH